MLAYTNDEQSCGYRGDQDKSLVPRCADIHADAFCPPTRGYRKSADGLPPFLFFLAYTGLTPSL